MQKIQSIEAENRPGNETMPFFASFPGGQSLLSFPNGFGCRSQKTASLCEVHIDGFFIAENIEDALEHGRGEMHPDDSSGIRVRLKKHAGIIEPDPGQGFSRRVVQLNLGAVCLIAIRSSVK